MADDLKLPDGFYNRRTDHGDVLAKDYTYNGKRYRQETLTMGQLLDLADLLAALEMPGVADVSDIDGTTVSITAVIRALIKARAHGKALAIILCYEDGTACDADDFSRGTADEGTAFMEEVLVDFFTFNSALSARLTDWFIRLSGVAVARLTNLFQRAVPYITSALATSQSAGTSSPSGKSSHTSGRRKR